MPRTRATRPVGRRRRAPRLHNAGTGARTAAAVRARALVGVAGGVQGSTPDSPDVSVDVTPAASVAANKRRCRSRAREPPPHRARRRCPTSCSRRRRPSAAGASSCVLHRESRRTQGGPHGPLSPLAGEDAAPEAALVVLSLTKFDVSHLSANNSVQHVPPHRIWEDPSLSRGLGLVLAGSADAHVAREPHRWRIVTLPRPWTVAGAKTAHGCARELPKASIACS